MKKVLSLVVLVAMVVLMLGGCAKKTTVEEVTKAEETIKVDGATSEAKEDAVATEAETVKIGVLVPLTGNNTQAGVEVQALCKLFEDAINNIVGVNLPFHDVEGLPNLNGAKVEFVFGDLSTPDVAMTEAERLINEEGVIGITGTFSSAATKTAAVATEKYGTILLSEGTSVSLLDMGYENYGRTYPNDASFVKDTFEYLAYLNKNQDAGIATVALVCEDSEFGTNIAMTLREDAAKYNFEIVEDISYNAQASNVTSEVLRLKQADPDVIIMSSYIADSLLFVSTYKEQNYFPRMLFGQRGGFTSSDFMKNLGEDANYCYTTSRWNSDFNSEVSQQVMKLYKSDYSKGIDLISDVLSAGWDAYLIAIMANQAGVTDVASLRQVMYDGIVVEPDQDPTGLPGYQYGEDGQNTVSAAIVLQMLDGEFITVYPENVAAAEGVYPALGWQER
ncbi:MAG: ABC transporter substrate-binding protein [Vallitaleaceae bacterium]|nr:ABC transporter substrate-binding protein [Vallitaleaceae bacterium]